MKLFLIDGHSLIFRMYYAFLGRPMVNSKGQDTSIIYGVTKYILEMIQKEQPTHVAVAFDPPGGTFRNQMYPEYKANRTQTPQAVIDSLEPLMQILESMGMSVLMEKGFEADDVIGTAAVKFSSPDMDVYMVTPDKDYGQLVNDHIFQYKPGKSGAESEIFGQQQVCEKYGIQSTQQVIDILTLCGDSADNVPGVQGVGPVGAAKLLGKFGTVENIYEHLDELTEKQRAMFLAAKDHIGLSKQLVTIKTDVPLDITLEKMERRLVLSRDTAQLLDSYQMPSLKRFLSAEPEQPESKTPAVNVQPTKVLLKNIFQAAEKEGIITVGLSEDYLCLAHGNEYCIERYPFSTDIVSVLENQAISKAGYSLKTVYKSLYAKGIVLAGAMLDVTLMHYILDPEKNHSLEDISSQVLGCSIEVSQQTDSLQMGLFDLPQEVDMDNTLGRYTVCASLLVPLLQEQLRQQEQSYTLYHEIEAPLLVVLARMELSGVQIDVNSLRQFADSLRKQEIQLESTVRQMCGIPTLNLSSPKQVGEAIYEKMKLAPKAKKPAKGNWPTDEETLLEIDHPIIKAILDYRGTHKLLSTYIDPLPQYISAVDGRVHTTFNQALTSTGRLSSSNPNLQNIPIRTEQGREIRKAFTAPEGCVIMSADYSQIELRVMAHYCQDPNMLEAFRSGADVHSAMAAKIFRKPLEDVSDSERRAAKTANFGIMYGISAFGLSQRLGCSRTEAAALIDDYFTQFPSIRGFIDSTLDGARTNGYVQTLFGRRRYVPMVCSTNANLRTLAERNAVNAPVQGSAADIIKLAMIQVDRSLRSQGLKARMVLQIHDELVLEVPEQEIEQVRELLVDAMQNVVSLSVPLTVECNYGKDWLQAH